MNKILNHDIKSYILDKNKNFEFETFDLNNGNLKIKSNNYISGFYVIVDSPIINYEIEFTGKTILSKEDIEYYNFINIFPNHKYVKLINTIVGKYIRSDKIVNNIAKYIDEYEYLYYFSFGQINSEIYDNIINNFSNNNIKLTTKNNLYNGIVITKYNKEYNSQIINYTLEPIKYICYSNIDIDILNIDSYSYLYCRDLDLFNYYDSIIFEALVIPTNIDLDNITYFEFGSGGAKQLKIPFELLRINTKIINNKYYIAFDKNLLSNYGNTFTNKDDIENKINNYHNHFEIYRTWRYKQRIYLETKDEKKITFELLCKTGIYYNEVRENLLNVTKNYYKILINDYIKIDFHNDNNIIIHDYLTHLKSNIICNGIIIKSYDTITNIIINVNINNINNDYIIKPVYNIIDKKDYYLYNVEFNCNNEIDNFYNNINELNKITVNLETTNNIYKGSIIVKSNNYLYYCDGSCYTPYSKE